MIPATFRRFRRLDRFTITANRVRNLSSVPSPYEWSSAFSGVEKAVTPPVSWYFDNQFYEKVEKQQTFRRWLNVGSAHALKEDGDYIAMTVFDQPIVVVKSPKGFNAFYNVCRHHAAQICDEGVGSLGSNPQTCRFVCPYHGWEYNIDGRLTKAVQMKGSEGFSAKEFGLHPLPVQIVGPWIYVNFNPNKNNNIHEDLPDLFELTNMLHVTESHELVYYTSRSYTIDCNWKVFIDNYLDGGYHVPIAHKDLTTNLDMKKYQRKSSQNFFIQTCGTTSSSSEVNDRISGGKSGSTVHYIYQYPNTAINRYGKWMDTNVVWPLGPNRCIVHFDWFVHPSLLDDQEGLEKAIAASDKVQMEDVWLSERVQKGIKSFGYDVGRYSPHYEGGMYEFHQRLHQDFQKSTLYTA